MLLPDVRFSVVQGIRSSIMQNNRNFALYTSGGFTPDAFLRIRMRKITQWCAIFGVKGFNRKVLRKNTRAYAENARTSKVELGSTFGCVRMRKSISPVYEIASVCHFPCYLR